MRISTCGGKDLINLGISTLGLCVTPPTSAGDRPDDAVIEIAGGIVICGKQTQNLYVHLNTHELITIVRHAVNNGLVRVKLMPVTDPGFIIDGPLSDQNS